MVFLEALLSKVGVAVANFIWGKIEERLEQYFEQKSQIKKIADEAGALNEELKNATTDAERFQILRKINAFSDRIGQ